MKNSLMILLSTIFVVNVAYAETFEIAQKNKSFSQAELTIKVGDTVNFPNKDPFFHNVYSLSAAKSFELGSYPAGESRNIAFDAIGEVDIECAIHPRMKLVITVTP